MASFVLPVIHRRPTLALKPLKPSKQKRNDKKHQPQVPALLQPPVQPLRRPNCKVVEFRD